MLFGDVVNTLDTRYLLALTYNITFQGSCLVLALFSFIGIELLLN